MSWSQGRRLLVGIGLVVWVASQAAAELPSVEVQVDTTKVTVGDPIQLTLKLRYRPGEQPILPSLTGWLQGFSPRPVERQGPRQAGGVLEQGQRFELRLYELGGKWIPPLEVGFIQTRGDTLVRASAPIEVEVVSVRSQAEEGLRDIKPPVAVPGGIPLWGAVVLAMVLLGGIGAGVYWFLRRRGQKEMVLPPLEPVDHAAEFIRIAGMGLVEKGEFKIFYSLLADNLRRYLEQNLGIEAMERTTAEIVVALQGVELKIELAQEVERYLGFADLVKFARFVPSIEQARRAPEGGIGIVRAIDRFNRERQALAADPLAPPAEEKVGASRQPVQSS